MALKDYVVIVDCKPRDNPTHIEAYISKPVAIKEIEEICFKAIQSYIGKLQGVPNIGDGGDMIYNLNGTNINDILIVRCFDFTEDKKEAAGFRIRSLNKAFLAYVKEHLSNNTKQNHGGKQNEKDIEFSSGYVTSIKHSTGSNS